MNWALGMGLLLTVAGPSAARAQRDIYDSGGPLPPEQAAFDVEHYDLALRIDPSDSTIAGSLTATVRIIRPVRWLVLDLDTLLRVSETHRVSPTGSISSRPFERRGGRIHIDLGGEVVAGERVSATIRYGGRPLVAPQFGGTWSDGFVWTETASGEPWIGVVSVLNGADIWWPVKDHPSDEPDSMDIRITVPAPLRVAANGSLRATTDNGDGTRTFHWHVSTPINNYGVTVNVAPYVVLEDTVHSVSGEIFPMVFYVLPEHETLGRRQFSQFKRHIHFFESILGPYPFQVDKYGVAETPYLGMETQTIIAYGSDFEDNDLGFDWLHFHEASHEWWANQVTAGDWSDWWLHEGFGTYMEALYAEHLRGEDAYLRYMRSRRGGFANALPLAPRATQSTQSIYGGDIYGKGAWVLHTLRFVIGKEAMFAALRRMAYPDGEDVSDGCRCRFATTDDFLAIVEDEAGVDLDWFFEAYLRTAALPELITTNETGRIRLEWRSANGAPFPMPVEVRVGGEVRRVELPDGRATIEVPRNAIVGVDPRGWILRKP